MPGSSALYCSGNFMVVTRLRAAVIASGDGACANAAEIEKTSAPAIISRRLDMGSSNDRSRDEVRKIEFPQQADSRVQVRFFAGDQSSESASGDRVCPDERGRCLRPRHKFRNSPRSPKDAMIGPACSVNFRKYRTADFDPVAALWTRINRELAPAGMEELFEQYIATTLDGERVRLLG